MLQAAQNLRILHEIFECGFAHLVLKVLEIVPPQITGDENAEPSADRSYADQFAGVISKLRSALPRPKRLDVSPQFFRGGHKVEPHRAYLNRALRHACGA